MNLTQLVIQQLKNEISAKIKPIISIKHRIGLGMPASQPYEVGMKAVNFRKETFKRARMKYNGQIY
jgi:hypothetical protein